MIGILLVAAICPWGAVPVGAFQGKSLIRSHHTTRVPTAKSKIDLPSKHMQRSTLLHAVRFASPLLEAGYPPAVIEAERCRRNSTSSSNPKPLLLYLPGFDGTLVSPFLQFPELGTVFEVRGMEVPMDDRSTFQGLCETVVGHLLAAEEEEEEGEGRPIYLMGESFGGLLSLEVALELQSSSRRGAAASRCNLKGLILINPATSYLRSNLATLGPDVAALPEWRYPFGVVGLLPLFTDDYGWPQLLLMLTSEALPSVIDTPAREAYMGRTAFSLPSKLKYMPRETLRWRLDEWLTVGNERIDGRLETTTTGEDVTEALSSLPVLVLAGSEDRTLPAVDEAERLRGILPDCTVHVVEGAGHAGTCGSRVDLAALMRGRFPELLSGAGGAGGSSSVGGESTIEMDSRRTAMKDAAAGGVGKYFGMEPRYDGKVGVGLSPLVYWTEELYREWKER